jgi:hypothetical protein
MSLEIVVRALDAAGVRYALIGGLALAARGAARATVDVDLLTADDRVLQKDFWSGLEPMVRKGDFEDPLAGVIRFAGEEPVDVVVAKYKWQRDLVERAEVVPLRGLMVRVPSSADLILLKLFAGGFRDLNDVRQLLDAGSRDQLVRDVSGALGELPPDMNERWKRVLAG